MASLHYYNSRFKTYYETISVVAIKNLKLRYRNSILGFLWTLINPLFMLLVFVFIFGKIITGIENYPLYIISGLIFWNFFVSSSGQMMNSIIESGGILKSVNVPPIIFPLSSLISNLINFLLTLIPFFIIMLFLGFKPGWNTLLIIPALLLYTIFTFGLSLTLSCFNVYFRDIAMFWSTITPALFYATPVVYDTPESIKFQMNFNPFAHFIDFLRDILYRSQMAKYNDELYDLMINHALKSAFMSFFFLFLGLASYRYLRKGFISNF
jgi:ABC-type polysaccharide/polyol phosphate export permease